MRLGDPQEEVNNVLSHDWNIDPESSKRRLHKFMFSKNEPIDHVFNLLNPILRDYSGSKEDGYQSDCNSSNFALSLPDL